MGGINQNPGGMIIIVALICISLLVAIVFLMLFIWGLKSGQYDDTYAPSMRILFEDQPAQEKPEKNQEKG